MYCACLSSTLPNTSVVKSNAALIMTWHLIGPSNLITRYFGVKTVRFESQEYTFSDKIIYFRPKKVFVPITRPSPEKSSESKLFIAFSDQNFFFLSGFRPSL